MKKNKVTIGILAHVDAGKTTLSEGILYKQGIIRSVGRVDHGDAFLDTHTLERSRGITIFSKQACFPLGDFNVTLLDTPGHMDFSAEMERTLQVLDYAILVINGADRVTGYVKTLWKLLEQYNIPVFIFVNKLDQIGVDFHKVVYDMKSELSERIIDYNTEEDLLERIALCDDNALETFLEEGTLTQPFLADLIKRRIFFPCFGGSALKLEGIDTFLKELAVLIKGSSFSEEFGGRIFKISRDENGEKLTHMKITGGSLAIKSMIGEEKVNQIRLYNGRKYILADVAEAGEICAVTGLNSSYIGQGLGFEQKSEPPVLETVLHYQVHLPQGQDSYQAYEKLAQISEEIPELHVVWQEKNQCIQVQLMGDVQAEILQSLVKERFGFSIDFGKPSVMYRETIQNKVEGIGHFEPLRHYAEVHLIMEPLPYGKGLLFDSSCKEDQLDRNWQRLILTHLEEKKHLGVLTGAPITDMKITLAAGKAHLKHTEGGDFRQATYRAVRQGLKKAQCRLLEPYYSFRLELPVDMVGRAMADIERMRGTCNPPETLGTQSVLTGEAPVSTMNGYQKTVTSYTKGTGRLYTLYIGYRPCHNEDEVIAAIGYDAEKDAEHPTGSVFCSHGAGTYIPWNEVEKYMHIPGCLKETKKYTDSFSHHYTATSRAYTDEELEAVFQQTYGISKRDRQPFKKSSRVIRGGQDLSGGSKVKSGYNNSSAEEILLIDGYNMVFAWDELKEMAQFSLESARDMLIDILRNYEGYTGKKIFIVFDGYKQPGSSGSVENWDNLSVIYTKENETADQFIEKFVLENVKNLKITVATSDGLEQILVFGQGALRMSAKELREHVIAVSQDMRKKYIDK